MSQCLASAHSHVRILYKQSPHKVHAHRWQMPVTLTQGNREEKNWKVGERNWKLEFRSCNEDIGVCDIWCIYGITNGSIII